MKLGSVLLRAFEPALSISRADIDPRHHAIAAPVAQPHR